METFATIFCIGLFTFYLLLLILLVWLPCSRRENSTRRLGTGKSKSTEATAPDQCQTPKMSDWSLSGERVQRRT